jgi:putative intracellular protease/amidase
LTIRKGRQDGLARVGAYVEAREGSFAAMTDHTKRVLMIVTSHARLGAAGDATATPTGFWLEELAAPYTVFRDAGLSIDIASPAGGRPPADPKSASSDAEAVRGFLADTDAVARLGSTLRLADVGERYDAYFVVGGHGVMWDLAKSEELAALLGAAHAAGKVVAAVCHGPAALVGVKGAEGEPVVRGRRVAAFSNDEENAVGLVGVVPFALETRLRDLGARYERGPTWSSFAVRDGNLVTGQNPQSSVATAREVLAALVHAEC